MTTPTRPVSGAAIASVWGQAVHDQVFAPKGVIAHGADGRTVSTSYAGLDLDTADSDPGGWLIGGNLIEVPTGAEGLYLVNPGYYVTAATTGQLVMATMALNGSVIAGVGIPCITSVATQGNFSVVVDLSATDQLSFQARKAASGGADPDVQLIGLSVVRLGAEIGA
jgi:hypothetical protein